MLDLIGCALWSSAFVDLGYALSSSAAALIGEVKVVERWLLGALVGAVLIVLTLRVVMRRRVGHAAPTAAR